MTESGATSLSQDIVRQLQQLGVRRGRDLPHALPAAAGACPPAARQDSLLDTGAGACWVSRQRYPPDYNHGRLALGDVLQGSLDTWADLAGAPRPPSPKGLAFLDIETTGLADGAGTYAFLVGLGFFEDETFCLEQFLMRSPAEERALLQAVADRCQGMQGLVTFNGRAFDLPILQGRYRLSRLPLPWEGLAHLDLLLPARRLFRDRLQSCSLSNLERHVLGVERALIDIPGWRIPAVYHDYLRGADAAVLEPVLYHNAQDVLSMVTLATRLARFLADPFGQDGARQGLEFYALARLYQGQGRPGEAIAAYRAALLLSLTPAARERAWECLAALYKRQGDWSEALEIWTALVERAGQRPLYAYVELAKYYEHRCPDLARAETLVRQAISEYGSCPRGEDLEHRLSRLRQKRTDVKEQGT